MTTTVRATWEYKVEALNITPLDLDEHLELNKLGAEGWELVSIQANRTAGAAPFLFIFKRQSI